MSAYSLRARIGAHSLHASCDSRALTENARAAFLARFEHEVDPDGELPEAERTRRAMHARKAHMARLALRSVAARRAKAAAREKGAADGTD